MKIKLTILSLLLCVGVMGCNFPDPPTVQETHQLRVDRRYITVTIDGCEYIEDKFRSDIPIVHKGNCNNPIHTTH